MDDSLFTNELTPIDLDDSTTPAIRAAIEQLRGIYPETRIYGWGKHYIAAALTVRVDLPSEGPVNGVDIREEEPVILRLHRDHYPHFGTAAYSNRLDFPRDQFPHLNPVNPSSPVSFCLHRDDLNEWMVERTISELADRVRKWLFDAASNWLIPPGDGWDPIRIVQPIGISVYPADEIQQLMQKQWKRANGGAGFSILRYRLLPHSADDPLADDASYAIDWIEAVSEQKASRATKETRELKRQYSPLLPTERHLLGMLIYAAKNTVCKTYFADIPKTLTHLLHWAADLGLPVGQALKLFQQRNYQFFKGIPIILAIKRPFNLAGVESDTELLNLVIRSDEETMIKDGSWDEKAIVAPLLNLSPLDASKAQEISRTKQVGNPKMLIVGCGALGSKLVMHMARAGLTNLTLVDDDILLPHNLVRHGLMANSVGINKADALREEIAHMYRGQSKVKSLQSNGFDIFHNNKNHLFKNNAWLVDTTASKAFQEAVVESNLLGDTRVMRAELAYEGQIGMMRIEGRKRNPRLDDIEAYLFTLACEHDYLSDWLEAERSAAESELGFAGIAVGAGCHTFTMPMADDVISFHAAHISTGFRRYIEQASSVGHLHVSFLGHQGDILSQRTVVPKFEILRADNNDFWEIRIAGPVKQEILRVVEESGLNETGGILIGKVNRPRRVIHVTKALPPPPDSQSTRYTFVTGTKDMPDVVKRIQSRTGGLIDYVGDWHTHPQCGGQMSQQDKETARHLQVVLKSSGKPVHIMIATPTGLHSHVYSGDSIL